MPFVKLDQKTLTSTIWRDPVAFRIFVAAMLAAEPWQFEEAVDTLGVRTMEVLPKALPPGWYGFARVSGPWLVSESGAGEDEAWLALERLCSPEAESRSREQDGRRLVRVDGGFVVVNYMKYRDFDHGAADRMRKLRASRKNDVRRNVTPVRRTFANSDVSREQRAENGCTSDDPSWGAVENGARKGKQTTESTTYLVDAPVENPTRTVDGAETAFADACWAAAIGRMPIPEGVKRALLGPTRAFAMDEGGVLLVGVPSEVYANRLRELIVPIQAGLGAYRVRFVVGGSRG
jgi:hypothetical protein